MGAFRFSSPLERRIVRRVGRAVGDFNLIEQGDHLLVALSGGKDSLSLLQVLGLLRRRSPVRFEMTAVTIDGGYPSLSTGMLRAHCLAQGHPYKVVHLPLRQVLQEKLLGSTSPCALCSRLRRGVLYSLAPDLGCNKIALGHHLDDLIETLLMNLFFGGQLRAMAPLLRSEDGRNLVIRPLCYVPESWLAEYARKLGLPLATCSSLGCGSADGARQMVKGLLRDLERQVTGLRGHALRALRNIRPEHLLDLDLLRSIGGASGSAGRAGPGVERPEGR